MERRAGSERGGVVMSALLFAVVLGLGWSALLLSARSSEGANPQALMAQAAKATLSVTKCECGDDYDVEISKSGTASGKYVKQEVDCKQKDLEGNLVNKDKPMCKGNAKTKSCYANVTYKTFNGQTGTLECPEGGDVSDVAKNAALKEALDTRDESAAALKDTYGDKWKAAVQNGIAGQEDAITAARAGNYNDSEAIIRALGGSDTETINTTFGGADSNAGSKIAGLAGSPGDDGLAGMPPPGEPKPALSILNNDIADEAFRSSPGASQLPPSAIPPLAEGMLSPNPTPGADTNGFRYAGSLNTFNSNSDYTSSPDVVGGFKANNPEAVDWNAVSWSKQPLPTPDQINSAFNTPGGVSASQYVNEANPYYQSPYARIEAGTGATVVNTTWANDGFGLAPELMYPGPMSGIQPFGPNEAAMFHGNYVTYVPDAIDNAMWFSPRSISTLDNNVYQGPDVTAGMNAGTFNPPPQHDYGGMYLDVPKEPAVSTVPAGSSVDAGGTGSISGGGAGAAGEPAAEPPAPVPAPPGTPLPPPRPGTPDNPYTAEPSNPKEGDVWKAKDATTWTYKDGYWEGEIKSSAEEASLKSQGFACNSAGCFGPGTPEADAIKQCGASCTATSPNQSSALTSAGYSCNDSGQCTAPAKSAAGPTVEKKENGKTPPGGPGQQTGDNSGKGGGGMPEMPKPPGSGSQSGSGGQQQPQPTQSCGLLSSIFGGCSTQGGSCTIYPAAQSIQQGVGTTLYWNTPNVAAGDYSSGYSAGITGIGVVSPTGSTNVYPQVTTTYAMTVRDQSGYSSITCQTTVNVTPRTTTAQAPYGTGTNGAPCPPPAMQPDSSQCVNGSFRPTSSTGNGCTTGWQCVPANGNTSQVPTAQISCRPQVADLGANISISYACANAATSAGTGFTTNGALSGATSALLSAPSDGSNNVTFGLACNSANQTQAATALCTVQVAKPSIVLIANPNAVASGSISQLGWVTSGMQSCIISSPDQADFTARNAGNTSVNGTATTSPITVSPTSFLLHCATIGGAFRDATTTVTIL